MRKIITIAVFLMLIAAPGTSQEPPPKSSEFIFARVQFTQRRWTHVWPPEVNPLPGPPWWHDWPFSDEFVTSMVEEVTGVRTNSDSHLNVQLEDPEIFKYPFLYISEPGFMQLSDIEVKNLGEYIRRGGFIMADDFREQGCLLADIQNNEFEIFRHYLSLAVPEYKLVRLDVNHPLFHQFFDIETLTMETPYCDLKPQFWGLEDDRGKLSLVASYNNDLGDYWEALDHGNTPAKPSVWASQLGVNYVLYAMSH